MERNVLIRALGEVCRASAVMVLRMALKAERGLYFRTGILLPLLRGYWRHEGRRLQRELNCQNGTAIQYGYIND